MMLIGFGVKILFLIHNRSYVNVMYKELGDFFMTNRKKVRVRKKREGLVIRCNHYHLRPYLTFENNAV